MKPQGMNTREKNVPARRTDGYRGQVERAEVRSTATDHSRSRQLLELMGELLVEVSELRQAVKHELDHRDKYGQPMNREVAAEYLGIHPDTLYRWAVEDGKIGYSRLGDGGRAPLRFLKKDLDDFMRCHRIPTVEELQ